MKARKNILVFILSTSLATAGATGLTGLATENCALAQSLKPSSGRINTAPKEKTALESMISTYTTPLSIILTAISGIITYSANESWKRRQYVEGKIKDFEEKLETINVRKMLSAELQCIELFPFLEKSTHRFVVVEDSLWAEALLECKCNKTLKEQYELINKDHPNFYQQKAAVKACIRDSFNRYLNHLQQFEKMIESKVINPKILKTYLDFWFEFIDKANDEVSVECPSSNKEYLPKIALLEYMGLLENIPKEELSVIQKDIRTLVSRFRPLNSFTRQNKQTSTIIQGETVTTVNPQIG